MDPKMRKRTGRGYSVHCVGERAKLAPTQADHARRLARYQSCLTEASTCHNLTAADKETHTRTTASSSLQEKGEGAAIFRLNRAKAERVLF